MSDAVRARNETLNALGGRVFDVLVIGGGLAGQFQAVVEVAIHGENPGAIDGGLGELAQRDLAAGYQHGAGDPGSGRVGGG